MSTAVHHLLRVTLAGVILMHLLCSPYTKVEESFNMQAIHDILTNGVPFKNSGKRLAERYDHFTFPGSVPRSFVGALIVSGIASPFTSILRSPDIAQGLVRGIIGLFNTCAILAFEDAVSNSFGRVAGYWFLLFQSSQFHIVYYASRTLPNSFAFGLGTLASRFLMLSNFGPRARRAKRNRVGLYFLALAGVIFRAEVGLLLVTHATWLFFARQVSLRAVILPAVITAMSIGLLITVSVDSFFWQSFPLWPEWVAFRFNALSGKSSEWGTSPWHYYFTSSIPKLISNPFALLICLPVALADRLNRRFSLNILVPHLVFVTVYSLLPHKEWRFVLYVIPPITAVSAAGASWIWTRRNKAFAFKFLALALVASTAATFLSSAALLLISSMNYPGGDALSRLHKLSEQQKPGRAMIRVHLDNLSCQTGVTRFLQKPVPTPGGGPDWVSEPVWYYDKTENQRLLNSAEFWERFDYVLVEAPSQVKGNWEVLEVVHGFAGVGFLWSDTTRTADLTLNEGLGDAYNWRAIQAWSKLGDWFRSRLTRGWWIEVKTKPQIYIMQKVGI